MDIYAQAREYMARTGNPNQWGPTGWPPEELIRSDISRSKSYVCESEGRIAATFFFDCGNDIEPTYRVIEDGEWLGDDSYGVVHRIASAGIVGGAGDFCIDWAFSQCGHLRIDTHPDNLVMQRLLQRKGFTRCGIIHVEEDDYPRYAYEKLNVDSRTEEEEEKMIKMVLWDVDGTLLDFLAAERAAIRQLFGEFGFGECSEEMLERYSEINVSFWERLERNELSKEEVLTGRFRQFFSEYDLDTACVKAFNDRYQLALGDTIVLKDECLSIIRSLRGRVRQYVVSNGTIAAQTKKLELSGIGELMDGIFLSEELGVEKPNPGFFEKVFEATGPVSRDEVLIVGDSLTSDIRGGMNAGIMTCWYNPSGKVLPPGYRADMIISNLHEVESFLLWP